MSIFEYSYIGGSMIEIMKALSDENRLRIVNILLERRLCVCEMEVMLDMNQSNVSRHLGKLKQAGIIESNKDGLWVFYSVADHFKNNHQLLLEYLQTEINNLPQAKEDILRLKRYQDKALTCQIITDDKLFVVKEVNA